MNCQSIKNKKAELHTIIDSAKPGIILGNESWLTPEIKNSEIFPDSFDARAFFHHFGTMTCTPGIGNLSVKMQKIGKFLVLLVVLSNHKIHHIFI